MNILILNASPRRKGITTALLAEVEKAISATHHTEVVRIQELKIKPCIGCLKCRPDKSCVLPRDDAHILAEKITDSDLMIIGSPVYWGNMPGTLKTFFDRNVPLFEYCEAKAMRHIPKPQLRGKKAILIVSGGSPFPYNLLQSQSRGTIRSLRTVLKAGGLKIESILNVPDSYNFEKKKEHYFNKAKRIAMSIQ
jgi:multimeric flavodoxin WrbA